MGTDYEYRLHLLSLGSIFDNSIPCNSVYNFNHYLCLSIKIYHMAEYFSLVCLQQNISAGASAAD